MSTLLDRAQMTGADLLASIACRYFSSVWGQDRKRELWHAIPVREQLRIHLQAEWNCAQEEHESALRDDRPVDAARYLDLMERLNIRLNDLEGAA